MVHAHTLRGALRWSAAEEAQSRIDAVRTAVDSIGAKGGASSSTTKNSGGSAANSGSAATPNGVQSTQQQELRHNLSELDAIRQFLRGHITTANRSFVDTGARDEQLHEALQTGLVDLETVRRRLVRTLAHGTPEAPPPPPPAAAQATANHTAASGTPKASGGTNQRGRPPSAGRARGAGGAGAGGGASRPQSATANRSAVGGNSDGSVAPLAAARLNPRPFSATNRRPDASGSTESDPLAQTASAPSGASRAFQVRAPLRRTASEGPKLATGLRARPSSATRASGTSFQPTTAAATQQPHHSGGGDEEGTQRSGGGGSATWTQYQDWAQKVLHNVQGRRTAKHREALDRERRRTTTVGGAPQAAGSSVSEPATPTGGSEGDMAGSGQQQPRPLPTRPSSAAFGGIRRAQQAAAAATTTGASRPLSATSRSNQQGAGSTAAASAGSGSSSTATPSPPTALQGQHNARQQQHQPQPSGSSGRLDSSAQSLREQGNVAFQQRRYSDAADAYGKAIALEPGSELLHCNRAAANLMLCRFHAALADAQAAVALESAHVKAHWRAAKACLYLGQTDQARNYYTIAAKLTDSTADREAIQAEARAADLVDRCRRNIRLREYQDAVKAAEEVLTIFPPHGPCAMPWLCLKAEASMHVDPQEALTTIVKFTTSDPTCAEAWYLRAKAVFYTGHDAASTSAALGFLQRAKDIDTRHSRAAVLMSSIEAFSTLRDQGNAGYAGGRWQEAYTAYTKCLAVDPYNTSLKAIILCNRSAVCIQCDRWKDALDDITQSINCNPQNAKAYTRRARIHQQNANWDLAVKDLQLAVQLFPSAENQERLQQAQEARARQQQPPQPQTGSGRGSYSQASASSSSTSAGAPPNAGAQFRYFTFGGNGGARPSTAGAARGSANSANGSSRPQSAGNRGANPYAVPPAAAASSSSAPAPRELSHYEVLCLHRTADEKTVTRAYRDAALKWHPDKWMTASDGEKRRAEDMFKRISTAYTVLKDSAKRRTYDLSCF